MMPFITCSGWSYLLMAANTYCYGAEPYDNIFSAATWKVAHRLAKRGQTMHVYWLYSSLIVHGWFCGGAAWVVVREERVDWWIIAVFGFMASHLARAQAYDGRDKAASILEVFGVAAVGLCAVITLAGGAYYGTPVKVWVAVAFLERLTHVPAALRSDASWMRSYELWLGAVQEVAGSGGDGATAPAVDSEFTQVAQVDLASGVVSPLSAQDVARSLSSSPSPAPVQWAHMVLNRGVTAVNRPDRDRSFRHLIAGNAVRSMTQQQHANTVRAMM